MRRVIGEALWLRCPRAALAAFVTVTVVGCAPFVGPDHLGTPAGASKRVAAVKLGAPGSPANRLDIPTRDLGPGDSSERAFDLEIRNVRVTRVTLRVHVSRSSLLDRDPAGLQIAVDTCKSGWRESKNALTYTCASKAATVLSWRPLSKIKRGVDFNVPQSSADATHLRLRLRLPATATNALQGKTSQLGIELVASAPRSR